jgi:hypothetical protein
MVRLTYKDPTVAGGYNAVDTNEYACVCALGKLEAVLEIIELLYKYPIQWKSQCGITYTEDYRDASIYYDPKDAEIVIYGYEFLASLKPDELNKTWWFLKD